MASIEEMLRALMQDRGRFGTVNYSPGMADVAKKALLGEQNEIEKRNLARRASPQGPKTPWQAAEDLFKESLSAYERSLEGDDREALLDILRSTPMVAALVGPGDTSQTPALESEYTEVPLDSIVPESSQLAGHIATEYPDDALTLDGDAVLSADDRRWNATKNRLGFEPDIVTSGGSPPPIVNALVGPIKSALADVTAVNEPVSEAQRIMAALEGFKPKTPAGRNLREQFIATQYQEQALQERADTERAYAAQLLEEERAHELAVQEAGRSAPTMIPKIVVDPKSPSGYSWMDLRTGTILGPAAPPKAATEIILGGPGDLKKGYRYTEEGAEYVPGGSEDPEVIAVQEGAKRRAALEVENEKKLPGRRSGIYADHLNAPTFATSVQRAIDLAGSAFSSGMAQQALDKFAFPTILGMELGAGFDLQSALSAVKANVGFDELIRIKEAGGTLGALSELENKLLQAMQGVLIAEEDADVLIPALKKVQQIYNLNLQQKKDEFKRIYGEDVRRPWEPPPDSGITQQEWDAIIADEPPPDSGITQQEWDEMTPEQKKAF